MLYADKRLLETELNVSLLAIRERELLLYTENLRQIATGSALLFGFAYSAVTLPYSKDRGYLQYLERDTPWVDGLHGIIAFLAMVLDGLALYGATTCAMLGPGLALRGPDGSMDRAVEGLALEYRSAFVYYMGSIAAFYASSILFIFTQRSGAIGAPGRAYDWGDVALHIGLFLLFLGFLHLTASRCHRIYRKFKLPSRAVVHGSFGSLEGAGAAAHEPAQGAGGSAAEPHAPSDTALELQRLSARKRWHTWPRRQYLAFNVAMDDFLGISHATYRQRYASTRRHRGTRAVIAHLESPQLATVPGREGDRRGLASSASQQLDPAAMLPRNDGVELSACR